MKEYFCKIFDDSGNFIKVWNDADIDGFSKSINGGLGEATISLARKFDDFGEDEDVALNNEVQIFLSDKDTTAKGKKIYSGYISGYKPFIDGDQEGVKIILMGYVTKLSQDIYRESYNCLSFVAANSDYISVPDQSYHDVTDALTIECWFKTETANDNRWLVSHDQSNWKYVLNLRENAKQVGINVRTASGITQAYATRDNGWNDGQWHYAVGVWERPLLRIYVDGSLFSEIEGYDEPIVAGDEGLDFGLRPTGPTYFNGQMMNVRLSNVARGSDEISMNWKKGQKLEADDNTFACYHFDEGAGVSVEDESGTQDGVINGADWLTEQEARTTMNEESIDPSIMLKKAIDKYRENNPNAKIDYLIT
jgi:hypothetical protein